MRPAGHDHEIDRGLADRATYAVRIEDGGVSKSDLRSMQPPRRAQRSIVDVEAIARLRIDPCNDLSQSAPHIDDDIGLGGRAQRCGPHQIFLAGKWRRGVPVFDSEYPLQEF